MSQEVETIVRPCPCCKADVDSGVPWYSAYTFTDVRVTCKCGAELEGHYDEQVMDDDGGSDTWELTWFEEQK